MKDNIKQELFDLISQTPGIVAFGLIEDSTFSKINKSLLFSESIIKIEEKNQKTDISFSIFISVGVNAKILIEGLRTQIKFFLKERNEDLRNLNIQIRGVM